MIKENKMIVLLKHANMDRFEEVMATTDREEAIRQAIGDYVANKGYYNRVELVECEGDTIEDFYAMEEKEGGYNPFWDMQEEK